MQCSKILLSISTFACLILSDLNVAKAQCTLPHQLTNGQTADATQVMANFNALVACLGSAAPAGSTNALQYKSGTGTLGGVGPLTDGQLVIGSSGNAPQAQTLTAGPGVTITNAPGSITIATSGGAAGQGLYRQVMSATPTSASTGLINWLNQGSAVVSDGATGLSISAPSSSTVNVIGRYATVPSPPYTIRALMARRAIVRASTPSASAGMTGRTRFT